MCCRLGSTMAAANTGSSAVVMNCLSCGHMANDGECFSVKVVVRVVCYYC
jgi:hypothetical protein